MRILMLNWKDPLHRSAGGAELYGRRVCEAWASGGHDVAMLVPCLPGRPSEEVIAGVRYLRLGSRATVFHRARRYLRSHAGDWDHVVDAVSTCPFAAHTVVGRKAVGLYYQTAREVWQREFPLPVALIGRYMLEPWWLRRMRGSRVVAISASTASDLLRSGIETMAVVPPGAGPFDPVLERSFPDGPQRVLFLGRLTRGKRVVDALEAFALLREQMPGIAMDVVGDGDLRQRLEGRRDAGVTWHGRVSEQRKSELLSAASVVLLPATKEGWGIVAMEAAGHGTPVVAYAVDGLREAVVDGATGVLCAPTSRALAEATARLLNDPPRWQRLSRAGHCRALEYSWSRTAERLFDAIAQPATRKVAA